MLLVFGQQYYIQQRLGEDSAHWLIAHLAHEYHIAPSQLLQESDEMLSVMHAYQKWFVKEHNRRNK
mgnify:CR=1 FL=1